MFERFTTEARQAVVQAQAEAHSLGHSWIGTEHVLLGVLANRSPVAAVLAEAGLPHDRVRERVARETSPGGQPDAAALADLGIDVEEVRRRVESRFGPGALDRTRPGGGSRWPWRSRRRASRHVPFTDAAKKSLELALREAMRLDSRDISAAHLVLGLLRDPNSVASRLVSGLGVDAEAVRLAMVEQVRRAA